MPSLKTRRQMARKRMAAKVFNLKWVTDTLDQIMTELDEYADREPEINAAKESILATKRLLQAYSQRMLDTPYKRGYRSRYDNFDSNYRFDSPSSIFQSQVDEKRQSELDDEFESIEKETESNYGLCRDDDGQFIDC